MNSPTQHRIVALFPTIFPELVSWDRDQTNILCVPGADENATSYQSYSSIHTGLNYETVNCKNVHWTTWDVGGRDKIVRD